MNRKPYSSAIKKTPFKYPIAKKMAKLMLDGLDRNEVFERVFTNNYIEIESEDRRREITNVIYGRLSALDDYLLSQIVNGDVATSKFILAYAIAKTDTYSLTLCSRYTVRPCLVIDTISPLTILISSLQ